MGDSNRLLYMFRKAKQQRAINLAELWASSPIARTDMKVSHWGQAYSVDILVRLHSLTQDRLSAS